MSSETKASSTRSTLPRPATSAAWLVSAGINQPTYTRHHYHETRVLPQSTDAAGRQVQEYEYLFKCFKTNAVRRYGTHCVLLGGGAYDSDSSEGVEAVN